MKRFIIKSSSAGPILTAQFTLRFGVVAAQYLNDRTRAAYENGMVMIATGEVRPSDGRRFMDALEPFMTASRYYWLAKSLPDGVAPLAT